MGQQDEYKKYIRILAIIFRSLCKQGRIIMKNRQVRSVLEANLRDCLTNQVPVINFTVYNAGNVIMMNQSNEKYQRLLINR